jgi:hypothetical protein
MKRYEVWTALMVVFVLTMHSGAVASVGDLFDGMVGHWTFDEGQGTVASDSVGGHDGVIQAATWVTGVSGTALEFVPGDDTKVTIEHSDDFFGPDGEFTVANWVRPVSRGAMMDKSDKANRMQWYILSATEDENAFRLHWGAGAGHSFSPLVDAWGTWHHVALVHTAAESTVYADGEAIFTEPDMGPVIPTTEPLIIGDMGILAAGNPKQQNFEGTIDEMGLWVRALSGDEVRAFMGFADVSPKGKLPLAWAAMKTSN